MSNLEKLTIYDIIQEALQHMPQMPKTVSPLLAMLVYLTIWICILSLMPKTEVLGIQILAIAASLVIFCMSLDLLYFYDKTRMGSQFNWSLPLLPEYGIDFSLGLDGNSFCFLLLTTFIIPLCLLACNSVKVESRKQFILLILLLELFLIASFITRNLFFFFVFFESVVIPMYILMGVYGARERKIHAVKLFFLYTLAGSFAFFFALLYIFKYFSSFEYDVLTEVILSPLDQMLLFPLFFIAFAVKVPIVPFHIWLPEAHVEAPTIGSVILASLLLKLGGYGMLRCAVAMCPWGCVYYQGLINALCVISIIYASLAIFAQSDLKRMIAYSSVAHMNLAMLGLFADTQQGMEGAIYLMITHGVVSAGLFFCIGVIYDRGHTRDIKHYSGLVQVMPLFCLFFFIFNLANMGFPGTSNFVGELLILSGLFENNPFVMVFAATGIVLSAAYAIWIFNRLAFGTKKKAEENVAEYADLNRVEFYILLILVIAVILLGVYSSWVTGLAGLAVKKILSNKFRKR